MSSSQVILITGAGSGFGLLAARSLAQAGHIVYGGLHHSGQRCEDTTSPNRILNIVCDITNSTSTTSAVDQILSEQGRLDVVIHNAGHMCIGPAEAFSPEDFHHYYEVNCVGAHRLNQAVLPVMRKAGCGHVVWVSSSSARGGSGPLLAPYFAAKAAMHMLALTLATEIAAWGIETTNVVPGIFTSGTDHFTNAGKPSFPAIAAEYMEGPLKGVDSIMMKNVEKTFPEDASPQLVAEAIVDAVNAPAGSKPSRLAVDPFQDGSDEIMGLAEIKHEEFLKRCGIYDFCTLSSKKM